MKMEYNSPKLVECSKTDARKEIYTIKFIYCKIIKNKNQYSQLPQQETKKEEHFKQAGKMSNN